MLNESFILMIYILLVVELNNCIFDLGVNFVLDLMFRVNFVFEFIGSDIVFLVYVEDFWGSI